ncbi:GGDEF domain-containing protein [Vibrio quintilis]|uniref:diguanylate cyclase n=1 Tax=Vibrio quintilis TaxID=1117707 RepID=A0A1M7YPM3_9VIBR|nr:GGDEF domain-containing protein [Vibrio quintilis]SHO54582.1 Response regulator PleD [Vibrio quintilis]
MPGLLNKIKEAGLDVTSVHGDAAIILWNHIRNYIASTQWEQAQCHVISAEYQALLNQIELSIDELNAALALLQLPQDAEAVLSIKISLCHRLIESGDYQTALKEYISISNIAVENEFIDEYALAVIGMGELCYRYGDPGKALLFYQKVNSIDQAISSRSLRLRYKICMLACHISMKEYAVAEELIKECEELSILVSDQELSRQIILYETKINRAKGNIDEAIHVLSETPYTTGSRYNKPLTCLLKIELAYCLISQGKITLAEMILIQKLRKTAHLTNPELHKSLYQALAYIYEYQAKYEEALKYEKKAYQIEADLMKQIPIGELGASQLKRLSQFELQLKLIMSKMENQELKETTESQKHTVARLQQDVFTDPLTKLHNRRWLEAKLKELLLHEVSFAFLIIDIDHFKSINDEFSHLIGDKAIISVSDELSRYFNFNHASCVRYGGEEFLVILENPTLDEAKNHGEKFRKHIYQINWDSLLNERRLTVSIGVTLHREGENTQRTLHRADKALYQAKANGRNQVCAEP